MLLVTAMGLLHADFSDAHKHVRGFPSYFSLIPSQMSHTISSSQSGRKITAAAATTGKAVVSTGKAVGGAIYSARTSISSWWHGGKRSKMEEEAEDIDPDGSLEST